MPLPDLIPKQFCAPFHERRSRAFTVMELLLAIAVIATVLAISLPAFRVGLIRSRSFKCIANLKTLYQGAMAYAADHNMEILADRRAGAMTAASWYMPLRDYVAHPGFTRKSPPYFCMSNPADHSSGSPGWTNYAINYSLYSNITTPANARPKRFSQIPSGKPFLMDSYNKGASGYETEYRQKGPPSWIGASPVHGHRINVIFTDGHVESPLVFPATRDAAGNLGELRADGFRDTLK